MISNTYQRLPISFTHGEGVWLYDASGNRYLDALAGVAVNSLGHAHPTLVEAITQQAKKLIHVSNYYHIEAQSKLAEQLTTMSGLHEVFFCNSGAEANEAAIKLSRLYGAKQQYQNPSIIVFEHAFHGRTLATLSATGNSKAQKGFAPLVRGFHRVPMEDLTAIKNVLESSQEVTAILLEPIQGEGGIQVVSQEFMQALRKICDEHKLLLILDEVQCGLGRTGDWFAYQASGIMPDVMCLAKGLGGGIPIGACLIGERAKGLFQPGSHGSTFGGNPLACTAALTVLDVIEQEQLCARAAQVGDALRSALEHQFTAQGAKIKGRGLMIGIEWPDPLPYLQEIALQHHLLLNVIQDRVIRLLPPLIFSENHIPILIEALTNSLKQHQRHLQNAL